MLPLWTMVADAFTRGLLVDEGDPDNRFHFDFSNIPQLQEDAAQRSDRATKLLQGSVITRNEARGMVGFEELKTEVGDVLLVPVNVIETPITGLPALDLGNDEEGEGGSSHDGDDAIDDTKELFGDGDNPGENGRGSGAGKKKAKKKAKGKMHRGRHDRHLAGQAK